MGVIDMNLFAKAKFFAGPSLRAGPFFRDEIRKPSERGLGRIRAKESAQAAGRIGGGRHRGGFSVTRGIGSDVYRGWLGDSRSGVQLQMVFGAGGAVGLAGVLLAPAGGVVASPGAIAVAGFGGRLGWGDGPSRGIVRFLLRACAREW